jgi:hypothetical protein
VEGRQRARLRPREGHGQPLCHPPCQQHRKPVLGASSRLRRGPALARGAAWRGVRAGRAFLEGQRGRPRANGEGERPPARKRVSNAPCDERCGGVEHREAERRQQRVPALPARLVARVAPSSPQYRGTGCALLRVD